MTLTPFSSSSCLSAIASNVTTQLPTLWALSITFPTFASSNTLFYAGIGLVVGSLVLGFAEIGLLGVIHYQVLGLMVLVGLGLLARFMQR